MYTRQLNNLACLLCAFFTVKLNRPPFSLPSVRSRLETSPTQKQLIIYQKENSNHCLRKKKNPRKATKGPHFPALSPLPKITPTNTVSKKKHSQTTVTRTTKFRHDQQYPQHTREQHRSLSRMYVRHTHTRAQKRTREISGDIYSILIDNRPTKSVRDLIPRSLCICLTRPGVF
jgi:hypothetical protein